MENKPWTNRSIEGSLPWVSESVVWRHSCERDSVMTLRNLRQTEHIREHLHPVRVLWTAVLTMEIISTETAGSLWPSSILKVSLDLLRAVWNPKTDFVEAKETDGHAGISQNIKHVFILNDLYVICFWHLSQWACRLVPEGTCPIHGYVRDWLTDWRSMFTGEHSLSKELWEDPTQCVGSSCSCYILKQFTSFSLKAALFVTAGHSQEQEARFCVLSLMLWTVLTMKNATFSISLLLARC